MTVTAAFELNDHQRDLLAATLPQALDLARERWPDGIAIRFVEADCTLTWSELRERVTELRSGLEALGVAPGDKLAILLRNQIEWPLTWLAAIEAGAVVVPLNPKYTRREIDFALTDTDARWLVAADDLLPEIVDGAIATVPSGQVVVVGADDAAPADTVPFARVRAHEPTARRHVADPGDVVNIQYTSGTTGLPKGCLLTHTYWLRLGTYSAALLGSAQRILADHPFHYMQNQGYFASALASGGAIYVTPGLSRRKFVQWLVEHRIDMAWIDEDLLDIPDDVLPLDLALKRAPVSALPIEAYKPLEERLGIVAREFYASTEVGGGTYVPYERTDLAGNGSMGFCWPERETKVVGEDLEELPKGTPGELCVRGPGMMLGYHNRPEVNAELFLDGGWFRTGDLVRKDADGQHYFLGRLKDMVRRSGENISCLEVEAHILNLGGIDDVALIPVPDAARDEEGKAIVVLEDGAEVTADQIVAWCLEGLAPFKVPRYFEFRSALPYTASGKVHKAALKSEEPFGPDVIDTRPDGRVAR
ncbi:MAG TPA: class I adenylate-forming enzyme family protein [Actinospica sp.]|jgi:acyl-CoA synthetase (AMP-forming)/AMP-acid ligase II|nr:class I adenylate-forming enzyme family protein [Actinospica sp.]